MDTNLVSDGWPEVWEDLTDDALEETLQDYVWLAANTPNDHRTRVAQLRHEAERRGKPEIIELAIAWLDRTTPRL